MTKYFWGVKIKTSNYSCYLDDKGNASYYRPDPFVGTKEEATIEAARRVKEHEKLGGSEFVIEATLDKGDIFEAR